MSSNELKNKLDLAQHEYNIAWAMPIDCTWGFLNGKIDRDLKLECAGDKLEKARIEYEKGEV